MVWWTAYRHCGCLGHAWDGSGPGRPRREECGSSAWFVRRRIVVIGYLQRAGLNVTAVQNPLIISEAGNDPKVSALVYVAARAPDAGEDFAALAAKYPKPPASAGVVRKDGFFWLSEAAFLRDFAGDVEPSKARALFAVQGRGADGLPNTKTTTAAWNREPDSAGCGPEEIAMTATRVQGELPAEFPARHP
jgi:hypothetical protein